MFGLHPGSRVALLSLVIFWGLTAVAAVSQDLSDTPVPLAHHDGLSADHDGFDEFEDDFFGTGVAATTTRSVVLMSSSSHEHEYSSESTISSSTQIAIELHKESDHEHGHSVKIDRIPVSPNKTKEKAKKTVEDGYGPLDFKWAMWVVVVIIAILVLVLLFVYFSFVTPELRSGRGYTFTDMRNIATANGEPVRNSNNRKSNMTIHSDSNV